MITNKILLIGTVGDYPIINEIDKKEARLLLATKDSYRNELGEKVKETMWHEVFAWGENANLIAKRVTKGTEIAIEGKLVNINRTDSKGKTRASTEVEIKDILILGQK